MAEMYNNGNVASPSNQPLMPDPWLQRAALLGPLVLQGVAILALGLIVTVHDGVSTQEVINALLVLIGGNALTALGGSLANAYSTARIGTAQATANARIQTAAITNSQASGQTISTGNGAANGAAYVQPGQPNGQPNGQSNGQASS